MPRKNDPWLYAIDLDKVRESMTHGNWNAVLDMLRHERAKVEALGGSGWTKGYLILEQANPPTKARWASFGLPVVAASQSVYDLQKALWPEGW